MIDNDIQNADGSPIRFADLDGTLLKFATEARPAKRAFAWFAEQGLRHAKKIGWAQQPSLLCLQLLGAQTLVTLVFVTDFLAMHWHCSQQRSLKQFRHNNYSLHTLNCTYTDVHVNVSSLVCGSCKLSCSHATRGQFNVCHININVYKLRYMWAR